MNLGIFSGVTVFILRGFEHCMANMFYFSMAGVWDAHTLVWLLIMTPGNAVGGMLSACRILRDKISC